MQIITFFYQILKQLKSQFLTQMICFHLTTLLFLLTAVTTVRITKRFEPSEEYCFSDDVPQHTLIKLKTKTQSQLTLQIYSQNVIIKTKQIQGQQIESWTSQRYGAFRYCFKNHQESPVILAYDYAVGQRAKDFTSSYDGHDYLKSLQNQARIAENFIQDIQEQNSQGMQILFNQSLRTSGYTCVYALSTVFVIVSVGLVVIQYKIVKKYLHNRKYL